MQARSVRLSVRLSVTLVSRVKMAESEFLHHLITPSLLLSGIRYRNEILMNLPSTGSQIHRKPLKDMPLCFYRAAWNADAV